MKTSIKRPLVTPPPKETPLRASPAAAWSGHILKPFHVLTLAISLQGLLAAVASAAILSGDFNDATQANAGKPPGSRIPTTGSITYLLTKNPANDHVNFHSQAGGGVSGQASDLAFDNTLPGAATAMGGTGGHLITANNVDLTLTQFTIAGWFKTGDSQTQIGNKATLFQISQDADHRIILSAPSDGALKLDINQKTVTTGADYAAAGEWVFFAVTFDGTSASDNVKFYMGSTAGNLSLVQTGTIGVSSVGVSGYLIIGANSVRQQAFWGQLDNFYFDDSVLSQSEINALRLDAIPETAASISALIGISVVGFIHRFGAFSGSGFRWK